MEMLYLSAPHSCPNPKSRPRKPCFSGAVCPEGFPSLMGAVLHRAGQHGKEKGSHGSLSRACSWVMEAQFHSHLPFRATFGGLIAKPRMFKEPRQLLPAPGLCRLSGMDTLLSHAEARRWQPLRVQRKAGKPEAILKLTSSHAQPELTWGGCGNLFLQWFVRAIASCTVLRVACNFLGT